MNAENHRAKGFRHKLSPHYAALHHILQGENKPASLPEYQENYGKLTLYCQRFVKDRKVAEDLASDTILKLCLYSRGHDIRHIDALTKTIARNHCLNYLEMQYNRKKILQREGITREACIQASGEKSLYKEDLDKSTKKHLHSIDQRIWHLFLTGYSNLEIGKKMHLSSKTIANRKAAIRARLRKALSDYAVSN